MLIDFDKIDEWQTSLHLALEPHLPTDIRQIMKASQPEFVEDALDQIFEIGRREEIIDASVGWISENTVAAYHGTKCTEQELTSIRQDGLLPLDRSMRKQRLIRALSSCAAFDATDLDNLVMTHGSEAAIGKRQGQVHLTLSQAGLTKGFNHYLKYGSEFDYHIAHTLLGATGLSLLEKDGKARVVRARVPGTVAMNAAHPYFSVEDMIERGETPNILRDFLSAWAFKQAYEDFSSASLEIDCGLIFYEKVDPTSIIEIIDIGP